MDRGFQNLFDWGFITSFAIASTAVVAIANTLRQWWKLDPRWSALIAAEALSFYGASTGHSTFTIGRFFEVLLFGALLCCYGMGLQATVVGLKHRFEGAARASGHPGWWASWF